MAQVEPFRAVRYDEAQAGPLASLVAPPYDVISPAERERLLAASPYNVVRLTLPETEAEAGEQLREWRARGVLRQDDAPAVWWLSQSFVGPDGIARTRAGVVVSLRVEPYETGVVRRHERTHASAREGRLRLLRATRTQLEPIFLLYDDPVGTPRRALEPLAAGEPLLEASDGTSTSRLWPVTDQAAIAEAAAALAERPLLIADGHHRYETALAFHGEDGSPGSAFTMAALINTQGEGLAIFPTHRVVAGMSDLDGGFRATPVPGGPAEALRRLSELTRDHAAFVLYRAGSASLVEVPDTLLDAAALDRLGLEGLAYTPRSEEAVARVDAGEASAALLVRAPTIEQVTAVAAAGQTMPQKSTYFFPKLLSGLLFHPL